MSKFIQSFYQYPVTFSSIGKTIPARNAAGDMKNIVEFSDKEIERVQNAEPLFRELLNNRKIRILNKLPASYVPPAQRINAAQGEAAAAKAEADKLKAENEALKAKLAALEGAEGGESPEGGQTAGEGAPAEGAEGGEDLKSLSYEGLKEKAAGLGLEFKPNVKKADLVKMIEEATAKAE